MTYNEFWYKNPLRVKFYRKSYAIKNEIKRYEIWEQGAYFYDSLAKTSILFRDLAKKGSKPEPYPSKPYGVEEVKKDELQIQQEAENERLRAQIHFNMLFKQISKRFENKVGEIDG